MPKDNNSLAGLATIFKNFTEPIEEKSLILITKDIREGKYRTEVEHIRNLVAEGKIEEADRAKKKLLAFATSATFEDGRTMQHFKAYSGFIILDLDKLTTEQYDAAFTCAKACPYTFCSFRSPKGMGFKILVKVNTTEKEHKTVFHQVADYYQKLLSLKIDRSGQDITRLCFMSYDPDLYKNLQCTTWTMQKSLFDLSESPGSGNKQREISESGTDANLAKYAKQFQDIVAFTGHKQKFENGNRNNFVYQLSCNCNRAGIPQDVALQLILPDYGYDKVEVTATVKSAYNNNSGDFVNFADFASTQKTKEEQRNQLEEQLSASPFIPDHVFEKLPRLLQEGCKAFPDKRERDVFLTGALTILSGCFTNIIGIYDARLVYPNLFCFVIAPAASGKGALVFARKLGDVIHNSLLSNSMEDKQRYEAAMEQYKMAKSQRKKTDPVNDNHPPEEPKFKMLFIPANSSTAAVMYHLDQNDGMGIMCETEADTLSNTLKQDWGGYSDLLRKAFHHEAASSSRKTNKEYLQVQCPRFSVALSGTPGQVFALIISAEDGLFSRFLYYVFKATPKWRNVGPGNRVNLTTHFETLSKQVNDMAAGINQTETRFDLTENQWQQLDKKYDAILNEVTAFTGEDAASTVKRLGLITFRIAMVLSVLRNAEQGIIEPAITCSDEDFSIALTLSDVYLQHALIMFKRLSKTPAESLDIKKRKFFEALPAGREFPRSEAVTIGKDLKIEARTADDYLKLLVKANLLDSSDTAAISYGHYRKL